MILQGNQQKSAFFCLFVMSCTFGAVHAELQQLRPEISVVHRAEVPVGQTITLTDISYISFIESEKIQKALNINIFSALADGESKKFKGAELIKIIRSKINNIEELVDEKWTYFVPEEVEIVAKDSVISAQAAKNQLILSIKKKCIQCTINIKDIKIPQVKSRGSFEPCEISFDKVKGGGAFLIPVQCHQDNKIKTYWISGMVNISVRAPVTNKKINPGEKISSKDFRIELVDITFAKDGIPSLEDIEGQIAARYIQVNEPIFRSDYKKELAVSRGQIVRLIIGNKNFEITSQATAEEQGYIGDFIKIKNVDSHKILSGKIVDKGLVMIQ